MRKLGVLTIFVAVLVLFSVVGIYALDVKWASKCGAGWEEVGVYDLTDGDHYLRKSRTSVSKELKFCINSSYNIASEWRWADYTDKEDKGCSPGYISTGLTGGGSHPDYREYCHMAENNLYFHDHLELCLAADVPLEAQWVSSCDTAAGWVDTEITDCFDGAHPYGTGYDPAWNIDWANWHDCNENSACNSPEVRLCLRETVWDCTEGGDHGGQDWDIGTTCPIVSGNHTNVGKAFISPEAVVNVANYDLTDPSSGYFFVEAINIYINGTLDAEGVGYGGGGTGGGAGGAGMVSPGAGGALGIGVLGGFPGLAGLVGGSSGDSVVDDFLCSEDLLSCWDVFVGGAGGASGKGAGPYGGSGVSGGAGDDGTAVCEIGTKGSRGTYCGGPTAFCMQDDNNLDTLMMGSGGAGGSGGGAGSTRNWSNDGGGAGGAGGAGGRGGGYIDLFAVNEIGISSTAHILFSGTIGTGDGTDGADGSTSAGGVGGDGGNAADVGTGLAGDGGSGSGNASDGCAGGASGPGSAGALRTTAKVVTVDDDAELGNCPPDGHLDYPGPVIIEFCEDDDRDEFVPECGVVIYRLGVGCFNADVSWTDMNGGQIIAAEIGDSVKMVIDNIYNFNVGDEIAFEVYNEDSDKIEDVVGEIVAGDKAVGIWTSNADDLIGGGNTSFTFGSSTFEGLSGDAVIAMDKRPDNTEMEIDIEDPTCGDSFFFGGDNMSVKIVADDPDDVVYGTVEIFEDSRTFTNGITEFEYEFSRGGNLQLQVSANDKRKYSIEKATNVMVLKDTDFYLAACIDQPSGIDRIIESTVLFVANESTRGLYWDSLAGEYGVVDISNMFFSWTFSDGTTLENGDVSDEGPVVPYYFSKTFADKGNNNASLHLRITNESIIPPMVAAG